jgi:hypothetical protein
MLVNPSEPVPKTPPKPEFPFPMNSARTCEQTTIKLINAKRQLFMLQNPTKKQRNDNDRIVMMRHHLSRLRG